MKLKNNQKAFTIIELLIASTVFSMIILGACAAIIQMSRLYYKGIILSRTQTTGRNLAEAIAREIQFQGGIVELADVVLPSGDPAKLLKINRTHYMFVVNKQQGADIANAIVKYNATTGGTETDPPDLTINLDSNIYHKILGNNMRILALRVSEVGSGDYTAGLYSVQVVIAYGDSDLLNFQADLADTTCKGNLAGSQWCSVVKYNTMVYQR